MNISDQQAEAIRNRLNAESTLRPPSLPTIKRVIEAAVWYGIVEEATGSDVYPCGYCDEEFESEEERTEHMAECPDREGSDR